MQEHIYATDNTEFERLLSLGFSEMEAARLVDMKKHMKEQSEYREMMAERHRLDFIRWLVEHDRISK